MADINNKQRFLKIIEILKVETDEENGITLAQTIDKLKIQFGDLYKVNRKSVKDDLDNLVDAGYILCESISDHNKKIYKYHKRELELYQLRMLIDAVSSARFITNRECKLLISNIKNLTSSNLARLLQNQIYIDDRIRCNNEKVRYYIDKIHSAISEGYKISFQYGNYNVNKKFILHYNGDIYKVKPYSLVWNNDYYYLIGKNDKYEHFINYRVDRMRNVEVLEDEKKIVDINVPEYINKTFNMYPGIVEIIKIQFSNSLINVIIDRFGEDVNIKIYDDKSFVLRTEAAISEGLVRWILTWGSDAKVLAPESLAQRIKEESEKIYKLYHGDVL